MRLWRISEFAELDGLGAAAFPGRWNEANDPVVYCCDHPATSLLEILVHVDRGDLPITYQLLEISAPEDVRVLDAALPGGWQGNPKVSRQIGTDFLERPEYPLMRIPSVVMPQAFNYLLNPNHPDASKLTITQVWRYPFDSRLLM